MCIRSWVARSLKWRVRISFGYRVHVSLALCCAVQVKTLREADPPPKGPCRYLSGFLVLELILNFKETGRLKDKDLYIQLKLHLENVINKLRTQIVRRVKIVKCEAALGGLAVSVLAIGPTGLARAGSGPAEDDGYLWVIKIRSTHFLRRGSKAVGPMSQIYGM
jgi:hypothetical protein